MHFQPDLTQAITCTTEVINLVKQGDYYSKKLLDHAFFALGTLNSMRPNDLVPGPVPDDSTPDNPPQPDVPAPFPPPFIPTQEKPTLPVTLEGCCDELEALCPKVVEGKVVSTGVPLATYWQIAQLLWQAIQLLQTKS